ncbi:hypothetical protein [Rhizobium sophoriradicis]|uniref:hypothetical protein n=1 Tax=Rhizobium sophoriradicis TaxID=1535245 RepID=UPI001AECA408|nr:hypothetical protein [Rhizobium sophoriradicis]
MWVKRGEKPRFTEDVLIISRLCCICRGAMMALLQMLNVGRPSFRRFWPACKIEGLVTAMRWSTMRMVALKAGCSRSFMNFLDPLPFGPGTSDLRAAAMAAAWKGFR